MYDRWDNEETVRKEAGKKFHYYWQRFRWMRSHMLYLFVIIIATTIALLWIPGGLSFDLIYAVGLGSIFAWTGVQIYFAYKMRESYKRWGGFDGGGGRGNKTPPSGGQSPEIYGN
jgi:hypothetical protein